MHVTFSHLAHIILSLRYKLNLIIVAIVTLAAAKRGWLEFCNHPRDPVLPLVKEFYANLLGQDQRTIWVRNTLVPLDSRAINAFYNLPSNVDCEY